MKQKNLILTIDYEVFLGAETGDIRSVLINPTYELMDILKINDSKMTVFWDILHYYSIVKWSEQFPVLIQEKHLVEQQIKDLVLQGHDVQMHLHPHWLDAKYADGEWVFDYSRFSLHKLSQRNDEMDINTIRGCVFLMKELMESVIRPYKPDYKVSAFRAGGYLIEPFEDLAEAFKAAGIKIDSSVCPGLSKLTTIYPYDFRKYHHKLEYSFDKSPVRCDKSGFFIEKPIYTVNLSLLYRIKHLLWKKRNNVTAPVYGGKGVVFPLKKKNAVQSLLSRFSSGKVQLTLDGADIMQYQYSLGQANEGAVMIMHPKMQNECSFTLLKDSIINGFVKFHSLKG